MAQQEAAPDGGGELHEIVSAVSRGAPEYRQCPHPMYAALRERDPVCRLTPPHGIDTYLITRHDDAREALSDPRFSKNMHGAIDTYHAVYGSFFDALDDNVLFSDPPRHTRLRRVLRSAFTPDGWSGCVRGSPRSPSTSSASAARRARSTSWPRSRSRCPSRSCAN